jgi:hypothetical protein
MVGLKDICSELLVGNAVLFFGIIAIAAVVGVILGFLVGKQRRSAQGKSRTREYFIKPLFFSLPFLWEG